jgi:hypothetical protein
MNKYLFLLLVAYQSVNAQTNLDNISIGKRSFVKKENDKYVLDENAEFKQMEQKYTYGKLRIYMLKANETYLNPNRSIGNYMSLQEALKANKIKITELNGGSVNTLEFENISKDTIMILAGEIVTGGKQDRVVGKDVLLLPKSGKVQVPVFCVEHGRWTPQGSGYQFNGYYGVTNGSVRKQAVVNKNQSQVWEKVADMNKKNKTETRTGTYAALQNSDTLKTELPKYMKHFENLMLEDTTYIGFVAVTGDTIISADLFANNQMFKKQAPQLVKSAAVEAISNGALVVIAAAKVMEFCSEFLHDESTQETKVMENGTMLKSNGKKVHLNYYKK